MTEYEYREQVFHPDETVDIPAEAIAVDAEYRPAGALRDEEVVVQYLAPVRGGADD